MGGIRYFSKDYTLKDKWRVVALNVLRRLRQDCLSESKFTIDSSYDSMDRGTVYLQSSRHLQYWCDVAGVSKTGYIRRLKRDQDLLKEKNKK